MAKDKGPPGQELHDDLLGQTMDALFDDDLLLSDVAVACQEVAAPSRRLSGTREDESLSNPGLRPQMVHAARRWKWLACGQLTLDQWLTDIADDESALKGFVDFIVLTRVLAMQRSRLGWPRLEHLLGLAALRLKLDPNSTVAMATAQRLGLVIQQPATLDRREIAAACTIRLATVRNALSRREMLLETRNGVALDEAMDWMIKRKGFLYPTINAACSDRHINGRLAASFLSQSTAVEHRRRISRLRLSEWQVKATDKRFAINDQGVQHCLMMLVTEDIAPLQRSGVQALDNRSHDPAARLYQDSFPVGPGQQLWQFKVPTMGVLAAILEHLGQPTTPAPIPSRQRGKVVPPQPCLDDAARCGLERDCQADQE